MKTLKVMPLLFFATALCLSIVCCKDKKEDIIIDPPVSLSEKLSGHWSNKASDNNVSVIISINYNGPGTIALQDLVDDYWGVSAYGTYTLTDSKLTANYTKVEVLDADWNPTTYHGFTDGQNKTVTYFIKSCDEKKLVIQDESGKTIEYEKDGDVDDNNHSDDDPIVNPGNNRGPVAKSFRGSGTSSDPYIISDASELRKLSDDCATGMTYRGQYFKMTANVTINSNVLRPDGELKGDGSNLEQWIPIGKDQEHPFCGTFDGKGHTISGLYIVNKEKTYDAVGLFSWLAGTVLSLTIKDSYISSESTAWVWGSGGICGRAESFSTSDNSYKPSIKGCINYSHIICVGWGAGGIVGDNASATVIDKCINYGIIEGKAASYCGGIIGRSFTKSSITNCVNYGRISNSTAAGILSCMGSKTADVLNCANFGEIYDTDGKNLSSCGICVNTSKAMNNCVNYGTVHFPDGLGYGLFNEPYNYPYNSLSNTQRNYYLETSCSKGYQNGGSTRSCISMTSNEMKQQAFLGELNKNAKAMGSSYCQWKFGKDGYPTLEIVKE